MINKEDNDMKKTMIPRQQDGPMNKMIIETEEKTMEDNDMKKAMIFRQQDGPKKKTMIDKEDNDFQQQDKDNETNNDRQ